ELPESIHAPRSSSRRRYRADRNHESTKERTHEKSYLFRGARARYNVPALRRVGGALRLLARPHEQLCGPAAELPWRTQCATPARGVRGLHPRRLSSLLARGVSTA